MLVTDTALPKPDHILAAAATRHLDRDARLPTRELTARHLGSYTRRPPTSTHLHNHRPGPDPGGRTSARPEVASTVSPQFSAGPTPTREPCFGTARSRIHIHILIQSTGHAHAVCIRPRHSRFHLRRNRGGICAARPASTSRSPAALPALHALIWRRVRTWSVWTRCGVCVVLQGISLGPKLVGRRRLLRWILHRRHGSRIRSPPIRHCRLLRRILHMRRGSRISWYSYSAIRPHSARAKPRPGVAPFVRRLRYDRTCRRGLGGGGAAA
jgi:hypothetical protein